jgi:hypothetical protein
MNLLGTKDRSEREDEEVERLVRPLPKIKPPRRDRRREQVQVDKDPDIDEDPDTKKNKDKSMNFREIGGSSTLYREFIQGALRSSGAHPYSSYPQQVWQTDESMPSNDQILQAVKTAIYHGVTPYPQGNEGIAPYTKWQQGRARDLNSEDFSLLVASARDWLKSSILSKQVEGMVPDARFRAALDLAIKSADDGKYDSVVDPNLYNMLLAKLAGETETDPLLTIRESSTIQTEGNVMTIKLAKEEASKVLSRLDHMAGTIQDKHEAWGMPFVVAKELVNSIDKLADDIEASSMGPESLLKRQVHTLAKEGKVVQKDSDEGYMDTFNAPTAPIQNDADENAYMSLFKDDQTIAVETGKSTTGRPLAP